MSESPVQQLRQEHDVVLMVLEAMEREVAAIERDGRVDAARVAKMVDFTRHFTDGCHHDKEERVLFPLLQERSAKAAGTVAVLLSEHEGGRQAMRTIAEALPGAATEESARIAIAKALGDYAHVLRLHITKEHDLLFPMVDELLHDDERRQIAAEFERLEREETGAGVHERYHELARSLAAP
jgi:hemerythrin-like domain-containing protein